MKPTHLLSEIKRSGRHLVYACAIALCGALLAGCIVTSVYPYYDAKSLSFEPRLLGLWEEVAESGESNEHWLFEQLGSNAFKVTYTSHQETNIMQGHTFKLNDELFLDLLMGEVNDGISIPAHILFRVTEVSAKLRMVQINYEWLGDLLEKNPRLLRHHLIQPDPEKENKRLVLTADTAELQRFIVAHLKTETAWKDEMKLKKK